VADKTSSRSLGLLIVAAVLLVAIGASSFLALRWWFHKEEIEAPVVRIDPPALPKMVLPPSVRFTDITTQAGIHFRHTNGSFGMKLLPETMGSGVAFLDYDNDGFQDILFVNSCDWPGHESKPAPTLALYRNKGDGTFEDVTKAVGLDITMYGLGVTVGDYDNDGWPDIFITAVGGCHLFHNEGGRRFKDVTQTARVAGDAYWPSPSDGDFLKLRKNLSFPSSAAFFDYDGDGLLDLFVCNYVTWSPGFDLSQPFQLTGSGRSFGPPISFEGAQCILYHNLGNGRFEDVSAKAGIQVYDTEGVGPQARNRSIGKALGVYIADVDGDGWPDIFVANDTVRNFFFHNKGDGTFEELGILCGVAYAEGRARGAMGIDGGYFRAGRFGVIVANFADEPSTFLCLETLKRKQMLFGDAAVAEGIAGPSRLPLKFGCFFFDYDLDGRLDLLTCNGHLEPEISQVQTGQTYEQPAQLFWNCAGMGAKCSFVPVTERESGPDLFKPMVGRGCAYADINGDGKLDVVLTANGGPARLLRNDGQTANNWIRLVLEGDGVHSNKSAIGAHVTVVAGDREQQQQVTSARGYLSQSELPLTFGLGKATKIDRVVIQWPGKNAPRQEFTNLAINKVHKITQDGKQAPMS
jgi:enediyne biosynthesis protein E4